MEHTPGPIGLFCGIGGNSLSSPFHPDHELTSIRYIRKNLIISPKKRKKISKDPGFLDNFPRRMAGYEWFGC